MRGKWDNLFWFERAYTDRENQLENNTTKGFLKVLQEVDDSLSQQFLNDSLGIWVDETDSIEYDVQVSLNDIPSRIAETYLLGLSFKGENIASQAEPRSGSGRVDGLISIHSEERTSLVAIEVKTGYGTLSPSQMGKYRGELGIAARNCDGYRWHDVYELLEDHLENDRSPIDRFLVKEFTDYLDLMNMVPFRGFDRDKLKGDGSKGYKQSQMKVSQNQKGAFAQSLEERLEDFDLGSFHPVSNQANTEVHLIEDSDTGFSNQGHFSAGFWAKGRFNVQLYLPNRVKSKVTYQGRSELRDRFVSTVNDILSDLDDITLTNDDNPVVYLRYQRNIQQAEDRARRTSTFHADSVVLDCDMDEEAIDTRLELIGRSVNEATFGKNKSLVLEKQIPYNSEFIGDERLPNFSLEYFETTKPLYDYFGA